MKDTESISLTQRLHPLPLGLQLTYPTGEHTLSHLRANAGPPTPAAVRRVEAAEDGSLSQGEIFSNEAQLSDLDHLPEGPWAPSDAREAQRINGKSVTSPRQGMVSQE